MTSATRHSSEGSENYVLLMISQNGDIGTGKNGKEIHGNVKVNSRAKIKVIFDKRVSHSSKPFLNLLFLKVFNQWKEYH